MSELSPDLTSEHSDVTDENATRTSGTSDSKITLTSKTSTTFAYPKTRLFIQLVQKTKFFKKAHTEPRSEETNPVDLETFYVNKELGGYSSEEEYVDTSSALSRRELNRRDRLFVKALEKATFRVNEMKGDASCFFRAVADQVFNDQIYHNVVRHQCMDHITSNQAYYAPFITEKFEFYVERKRMVHSYASKVEIQAVAELYSRNIEVYFFNKESIENPAIPVLGIHGFNAERPDQVSVELCFDSKITVKNPIQLSYHNDDHYNSLAISVRSVGFQTRKLGKKVLKELSQGDVESASGSTGIKTGIIKLHRTAKKGKKDIPTASTSEDPREKDLKPAHRSMANDTSQTNCDYTWMAMGLEAHTRFLKDTLQGRTPFFYSSPFHKEPRKISKATLTLPVSASSSSTTIPQSVALVASTSAVTSTESVEPVASTSPNTGTSLKRTPTESAFNIAPSTSGTDGKNFRSTFKKLSQCEGPTFMIGRKSSTGALEAAETTNDKGKRTLKLVSSSTFNITLPKTLQIKKSKNKQTRKPGAEKKKMSDLADAGSDSDDAN